MRSQQDGQVAAAGDGLEQTQDFAGGFAVQFACGLVG